MTPNVAPVRVIWNPNAGSKAGLSTNGTDEPTLRALMSRHGLGDDLRIPGSAEEAIGAAREAVDDGVRILVAAGGDGTVSSIGFELLGTETALGILPLGSVMNVARSLGIPREIEAAAEILERGYTRRIDVGYANGVPFLEAGSVGLNAAIFGQAQRFDHGHYGSIVDLIRVFVAYQPGRMRIVLDDRVVRTRALMITVANGPYTGLGMTFAPDARLDDGRFDIRVFRGFSKWELVRHLGSILLGRRAYSPKIRTYRSQRVVIDSSRPRPSRVDAKDLGMTPVEFRVAPQALRVVVPAADPSTKASEAVA